MSNFLQNGAVLPHGLLGHSSADLVKGFNKSYRAYPLRLGVVKMAYPVTDDRNKSKLTTEYDVSVFEATENDAATPITYRNCMSSEALGSIADYFEMSLRPIGKSTLQGEGITMKEQDGAVVLLLCLDAMSTKGIIISSLTHPARVTNLQSVGPTLAGEFNGVNIKVNTDGSTSITFQGATDNQGKPIDSSQGNTELSIEKDGSYQVMHKTIKQRLDKNGKYDLTTDDDISNTTKTSFNVTTTKDVNMTASGDMTAAMTKLTMTASGSATLSMDKLSITAKGDAAVTGQTFKVEAQSMASIKAPQIVMDGLTSIGGQGGQPILLLSAMFIGTGNLGLPVISQAISGFSVMSLAT
jgi:hypothetical protein